MPDSEYRPEIDGLRAIAVIAVVIYHAKFLVNQVQVFAGGFVGVDVFFVISGYLICLIILRGLAAGSFTFIHFYERRVRRILPVLFVVMMASTYLAWRYFLPRSLVEYSASLLSSLAFFSNVWFWREDSYTADVSALKPLLHTWSLAVEEQFYLFFPPLLILLWKVAQQRLLSAFIVLFVISFLCASSATGSAPGAAFYLLPFRGWELLAGAILACLELRYGRSSNGRFAEFFAFVGLALIGLSVTAFYDQTPHPSWPTLLPVAGTAMVIWFGKTEGLAGRLLSSKALVGIGLISYSLYLWHFPIFAVARTVKTETTNGDFIALIGLSFALSIISYYAIEKPFRNATIVSKKLLFGSLLTAATSLLILNTWIIFKDGFPARPGVRVVAGLIEGLRADSPQSLIECIDDAGGISCEDDTSTFGLVGIGDSHLNMLADKHGGLPGLADDSYASLYLNGCPMIRGSYKWYYSTRAPKCEVASERVDAFLSKQEPLTIIYSARLPLYLSGKRFDNEEGGIDGSQVSYITAKEIPDPNLDGLEELVHATMKRWLSYGHTLVLVYPVPEIGWNLPKYIMAILYGVDISRRADLYMNVNVTTDYAVVNDRTKATNSIYDALGEHENLIRIRPEQMFCSKATMRCNTHDGRGLFYQDSNHLSVYGASFVVKQIQEEVNRHAARTAAYIESQGPQPLSR